MAKSEHILTFLKRVKEFSQSEGIASILKLDKDNEVGDDDGVRREAGGLICDIDNGVSSLEDALSKYYEKTGDKKNYKRLKNIIGE